MYAAGQIVYDLENKQPTYAYHTRRQTHFLWTKKAIKEYPGARKTFTIKNKTKYCLFNPIATPLHITETKLLLKKGYIAPATLLPKKERDYILSYAERERLTYELKKALPTKLSMYRWKNCLSRYFYAFILRKEFSLRSLI